MLGRLAMAVIVADWREPSHGARVAWSSRPSSLPILGEERFRRGTNGNLGGERWVPTMMFAVLIMPVVLLGVLLGMDRLERWTVDEPEDSNTPS
jgi:hypothetical protein